MVTDSNFDSLFDYGSIFQYDSITPLAKGVNRTYFRSPFTYHSISIDGDQVADKVEEGYFSSVLRKSITVLTYLMVILTFPVSFWICVKRVHALERIVLMRLGKLQDIRGPGFAIILPIIDNWTRVNLRPQSFTVSATQILTADGGVVEITSDIDYQVTDVISYVMKLSKQEKALRDLGLLCLKNMISEKDQDDLENKRDLLCSFLKDELNQSFINWGLEILTVHLHSPNILKPAEPVDALGTLMIALKAATGHSSQHTAAVFPIPCDNVQFEKPSNSGLTTFSEQNADIIDILKNVVMKAEKKDLVGDLITNIQFDIVTQSTKTVYLVFENGHVSIISDPSITIESDMSLIITEECMRDFLSGRISPLDAYIDGKVTVTGDWRLLRPLARILEESLL